MNRNSGAPGLRSAVRIHPELMNEPSIHGFRNREDAGRRLAALLAHHAGSADVLVIGLARGGLPIASEIAKSLGCPLDVMVVRKLGVPGHEEVAMGAIAAGVKVFNESVMAHLHIGSAEIERVVERETRELERRERDYRGGREAPVVEGKTVILVDDGIATGASVSAAVRLLRLQLAGRIVVAVPVAPPDSADRIRREADELVVAIEPESFVSVSRWYDEFEQTTDAEVRSVLAAASGHQGGCGNPLFSAGGNVLRLLRRHALPITGSFRDHDGLMDIIGDASVVLLGSASHGTHEFYRQRARITKRLITEKGFNAVAAEADWADAYRVNRFVRREGGDLDSVDALSGFDRFPSWMWRNADVLDFVGWLRDHNESVWSMERQVGFYGLDLYSLHKSMNEVIACLERKDPADAAKAQVLYGCIDRFGRDPQNYGLLAGSGVSDVCRAEVIRHLAELRAREVALLVENGPPVADESFFFEQNSRLERNAERYYRDMFRSYVSSWNQRDEQMMELLVSLIAHLQSTSGTAKVIVWAHNSHVGDARATEMAWHGELNMGQLAREAFGDQCRLIGFTTYAGSVTAASGWCRPAERKQVRPGLDGGIEKLFHQVGVPNFMLDLTKPGELADELAKARLQRAVGIVYLTESERQSHYFEACLSGQFDAVLHHDLTRAVEPLERNSSRQSGDLPVSRSAGL